MKFLFLLFIYIPFSIHSQKIWSLEQCIDTAILNNQAILKMQISNQISISGYKTSKLNILPKLNGNISHGYNWGQTIDLFTNQFATNRVQFDNFYLSSSISLFQGLQKYYQIQQALTENQKTKIDVEILKRNIRIDVTATYLQILLNQEILKVYFQNIELNKIQLQRIQHLLQNNQSTEFEKAQIVSQLSHDQYRFLKAENDLKLLKISLQNLLNIPISNNFAIKEKLIHNKDDHFINIDSIDRKSLEIVKLDIEISKQNYLNKLYKGQLYPSIILNGSIGSGYSENNKFLNPNGQFTPKLFNNQINENFYKSLYVTLSIPFFNNGIVQNNIKINKLYIRSLELERELQVNTINTQLNKLIVEINNLSNQKISLEATQNLVKSNFENTLLRYENGNANFFQLSEARNKLLQIESEIIQINYDLIFKQLILGYYIFN